MEGGSRERRIIIQDPLADDVLELKKIVDEMSRNAKNQQNDLDVIHNFLIEKEIRYTETINSNIKIIHQYESFMNQLKKIGRRVRKKFWQRGESKLRRRNRRRDCRYAFPPEKNI